MNDDSLQLLSCVQGIDVADESIGDIIKGAVAQRAKESENYSRLVQLKNHLKTAIPSKVSEMMPDVSSRVKKIADRFNFTDGKDFKLLSPGDNAIVNYDEKDVYIGEFTIISFKGDKCDNGYLEQRYNKIGYKTYKDYTNAIRKFKTELIEYLSKVVSKRAKKSNDKLRFRVFENDSEIKIFVYDDGYCKIYLDNLNKPITTSDAKKTEEKPATEAAKTPSTPVCTKEELNAIVKNVNKAYGINVREWKKEIMVIMARYGMQLNGDYIISSTIKNPYLDTKTGRIFFPIVSITDDAPVIFRKRCDSLREVNNYITNNLDILEETYPAYNFRSKTVFANGSFDVLLIITSKYRQ